MYKRDDGIIVLSHDSFGRFETLRKKAGKGECSYCGRNAPLYYYGTEPDDSARKRSFSPRAFCSIGCERAYLGG